MTKPGAYIPGWHRFARLGFFRPSFINLALFAVGCPKKFYFAF